MLDLQSDMMHIFTINTYCCSQIPCFVVINSQGLNILPVDMF